MPYLHTSIIILFFFPRSSAKEYAVPSINTPRTAYSDACAHLRTGKSIFSANCSCLSSGQDLYSGITIFPINFPTEWLITVDSSAFFAENEKNHHQPDQHKKQPDDSGLISLSPVSRHILSCLFLPVHSHAFDIIPAVISRILRLKILQTDLSDIHRLQSVLQTTLLQPVCLLYKLRQTICPVSPEV